MMGDTIWVESEQGEGSTFYFNIRLPLAKEPPSNLEAPVAVPTTASAQLRILLAEDNPANQKLATYILQDRGHVLEIAGNGQQAIDLSEQNCYDVILMDVEMPGMNGLEAAAVIRKREAGGRRVPIIAMTAHAMKGDRERCLTAGMDGYLSKPIDGHEMIALVEGLAAGGVAPRVPSHRPTADVFDPELALKLCFNNQKMLGEMMQSFFDESHSLLSQMRTALLNGDLAEVGQLGHRMKGTVLYLGAEQAKQAASRVERFCKSSGGTPSEAAEAIKHLNTSARS
jgi:two-component system, sensor histidine kinase and response regulator